MILKTKTLSLILLGVVVAAAGLAPRATASTDTRYLDTYQRQEDGFIGPLATSTLLKDRNYVLVVTGTFSVYSPGLWRQGKVCGKPEKRPLFASPGRPVGPVGTDPLWVFAERLGICRRRRDAVAVFSGAQFAVAKNYRPLIDAVLPFYSGGVRPDHSYRFAVAGAGKRLHVRIKDPNSRDNYGRLRVTVRRAVANDCLNGDFTKFGFADAATCAASITQPKTT